jgi:glutamate racemase
MNIGVFDSGVGGLWILKNLKIDLPEYNYIYFGDQAHIPYGKKSLEEIKKFSEEIVKFLINKNCQIIVIACNTASTASLKYLREKYPNIIFVGMEPAVKSAVEITQTKRVGVLATPATFQGQLYHSVVERFAQGVEIFTDTCPGLVEQIEKGDLSENKTEKILEKAILPMLEKNIDTIVLGCTHYPFVIPLIKKITREKVNIIDPTSAIVKRVEHLLEFGKELRKSDFLNSGENEKLEIFTSGQSKEMEILLSKLFSENIEIKQISWNDDLTLNMLK